jgi:peptide/nickel transport system ATP-binding protein
MSSNSLLIIHDLKKYFSIRNDNSSLFKKKNYTKAVDGISLSVSYGKTLAIVGESGCGKTTIARTIMQLTEATSGLIFF